MIMIDDPNVHVTEYLILLPVDQYLSTVPSKVPVTFTPTDCDGRSRQVISDVKAGRVSQPRLGP